MITKEKIIETIKAMPEEKFDSLENVIEEIILLEKVERGLEDLKNGSVLTEEELDKEIEKW